MIAMEKIKSFFQKYKTETIIFSVAFLIRIFALIAILWWLGGESGAMSGGRVIAPFPVVGDGDSFDYYRLTENLINNRHFSLSDGAPFFSESLRVPAYPLFLAAIVVVFKHILAVSAIQNILAALSAAILYKTARLFLTKKISIAATAIFAFEPGGILVSNVILSETLFIFLFLLAIYLFLKQKDAPSLFGFFAVGFIIGIMALTRPVALFLPFIFMVFALFFYRGLPFKTLARLNIIFFAGFLLVIIPWSVRNKIIFNSWQISSVGAFNFYNYYLPEFISEKQNKNKEQVAESLRLRLSDNYPFYHYWSLKNSGEFKKISGETIKANPFSFAAYYLRKTLAFFFTNDWRVLLRALKMAPKPPADADSGKALLGGNAGAVSQTILSGAFGLKHFILLGGFLFWGLIDLLIIASVAESARLKNRRTFFTLFLFSLIIYFALATGPAANEARYRLPVVPLMFVLAAIGFNFIYSKIYEKCSVYRRHFS